MDPKKILISTDEDQWEDQAESLSEEEDMDEFIYFPQEELDEGFLNL